MGYDKEYLLFGDRNDKLNNALKIFEKTKGDLDQDLEIVKEWLKTQHHFPEIPRE